MRGLVGRMLAALAEKLGLKRRSANPFVPKEKAAPIRGYSRPAPLTTKRVARRLGKLPKRIFGARYFRRERMARFLTLPDPRLGRTRYLLTIRGKTKAQGPYRVPRAH